jgi:hypothetical protein
MPKRTRPTTPIEGPDADGSNDEELLADYPDGDSSTDEEVPAEPSPKFMVAPTHELKMEWFSVSKGKLLAVNGNVCQTTVILSDDVALALGHIYYKSVKSREVIGEQLIKTVIYTCQRYKNGCKKRVWLDVGGSYIKETNVEHNHSISPLDVGCRRVVHKAVEKLRLDPQVCSASYHFHAGS